MSAALFVEDPWAAVPGQEAAVAQLRSAAPNPVHAYLVVGPEGAGKERAARVFAGEVLAAAADDPSEAARHRSLAVEGTHPDVEVVTREGASIRVEQADAIVRRAALKPVEGRRKVLILEEFHLVSDGAAGKLLKTIEEPPPGTVFVVLADEVPDSLVTIASRCVRIEMPALTDEAVVDALVAAGVPRAEAVELGVAAHGDLDRARLLATDERFALRLQQWRAVPAALDGTGATVCRLVAELRAAIDDAAAPLEARQVAEVAELHERIERYGQRGSGASDLEARHKRQLRRLRTDEVRMGLAELAHQLRDRLLELSADDDLDPRRRAERIDALSDQLAAIWAAADALVRNPNEELLLHALLLRLSPRT